MTPHDAEAARLLALGERCRQIGDYAQAAVCFEEAHLVSPTSIAGRLAIDRLREMEVERFGGPRGAAEEAELPAFATPQRPVIEPREGSTPRQPASQPGTSPERKPQLPPVPTPNERNELQKLKEMLDSTVPLGGAEEQGATRQSGDGSQQLVGSNKAVPTFVSNSVEVMERIRDLRFQESRVRRNSTPPAVEQSFLPFIAWTRVESVADWVSAAIYARGDHGFDCSTCFPPPPAVLDAIVCAKPSPVSQHPAPSAARQPYIPFLVWTRADLVADWGTAVIYARRNVYAWWETTFLAPPEPGDCDGEADKHWWLTSSLSRPTKSPCSVETPTARSCSEDEPFRFFAYSWAQCPNE
jgi:hypothetical protein